MIQKSLKTPLRNIKMAPYSSQLIHSLILGEAHRGVKGFVKDQAAQPIEGASMKV